jgi:hypothetical protein
MQGVAEPLAWVGPILSILCIHVKKIFVSYAGLIVSSAERDLRLDWCSLCFRPLCSLCLCGK